MEINDEYMLIISNLTVTSFVSDFDELLFVIGFAFVYVKLVRQESIVNSIHLNFVYSARYFPPCQLEFVSLVVYRCFCGFPPHNNYFEQINTKF